MLHQPRAHAPEAALLGGHRAWVLAKRLEAGRFSWPEPSEAKRKLALALLVGGVELKRGSLKPWYERDEK